MTNLHIILKRRDITLPTKFHLVKAMVFPVFMYGCESRTIKKTESRRIDVSDLWCWRRLLRVPWTAREIQPVYPKGDQSWKSIGRTEAEVEAPILWPPNVKNWLIGKDLDAGKDWRQEEKGMTEDEMFGWHHQLNGHEFEQAPWDGEGQGGLKCCSPWGHKACVLSHFSCVWLSVTLWTAACQAPPSIGFSRQEYWSGLLCPPPGDLLDPGLEPTSQVCLHWQVGSLPLASPGKLTLA